MPTNPLLAMARTMGNPVIDGNVATFLWQGLTAPLLIDDFHHWEDEPQILNRAGAGLWMCSIQLPAESYLEYAFVNQLGGEHLPDPLNPNKVNNGAREFNNFFYMPPGQPTTLTRPAKGIARGTVTRHQLPTSEFATGKTRTVYLYQPPVKEPVPLLVVYDGVDYLKRAKLDIIVDNLIAEKQVHPFGMALVENGGAARTLEYSCCESTLEFVFECVITLAQEHLTLKAPGSEPYGVLGASLGGLAAMYTGMRLPQVFGKVLSQSGAFDVSDFPGVIADLARYVPPPGIEVWMDAGKFEWILEDNRKMFNILQERKYHVKYHEFTGGHNYTSWRNDVWRGLEALFGK